MSTGTVCLKCRKYFIYAPWGCTCDYAQPSEDAKTPLPESFYPMAFRGVPGSKPCRCGTWLYANGYEAGGASHRCHSGSASLSLGGAPQTLKDSNEKGG